MAARARPGRSLKSGRCARCRHGVLRGWDADPPVTQWLVELDPRPISADGEALALLAGRRTFDVVSGRAVGRDTAGQIRRPRSWPVHAQHTCGIAWPPAKPGDPGMPPKRLPGDKPPY